MSVPEHLINLSPSLNSLKRLEELAGQIARRDQLSLASVLGTAEIIEICGREKLGRKDKLRLVRLELEKRRYPLRAKLIKELESCQKTIQQKAGISFELPLDLEGDRLFCRLAVRSPAEIRKQAEKLESAADLPETARIFAILAGEIE